MVHHDNINICGPLLLLLMKQPPHLQESILAVHIFIPLSPSMESSPACWFAAVAHPHPSLHCETGSLNEPEPRYYFDDPLWDSEGCEGENECCDRGGPYGSVSSCLNQLRITYIEMRVCTRNSVNSDEDVPLKKIKLFIH